MSPNLTCFVLGIPLTFVWLAMLRKGITLGRNFTKIHREDDPVLYWFSTAFYGMIVLGFLVMPALHWTGLR